MHVLTYMYSRFYHYKFFLRNWTKIEVMYALLQVTCQVEGHVRGVVHLCGVAPVVR